MQNCAMSSTAPPITQDKMCEADSYWEVAKSHRECSLALCDDLEEWDGRAGEGGSERKGHVYDHD